MTMVILDEKLTAIKAEIVKAVELCTGNCGSSDNRTQPEASLGVMLGNESQFCGQRNQFHTYFYPVASTLQANWLVPKSWMF